MNEHDFEDPTHDAVRRLLAQAAAPASVPADVATTLEETLADLVAEQSPPQRTADLGARRSRWAPGRILLAAAAVVVVGLGGLGIGQLVTQDDSSLATSTAESDAAAPGASDAESAPPGEPAAGGVLDAPAVPAPTTLTPLTGQERDRLGRSTELASIAGKQFTAAGFERQVTEVVLGFTGSGAYADQTEPGTGTGERTPMSADNSCAGPATVSGAQVLPITFEDRAAVLVLNPVIDGERYVAAWSCDGTELLASTTVR